MSALAARLHQAGHQVSVFAPDDAPGDRQGRRRLLEALREKNLSPRNLIFGAGTGPQPASAEQLCMDLLEWFLAAEAVNPRAIRRLFLTTPSVFPVLRQHADSPFHAPLLSMARGISQEYPHVACKVIDTECSALPAAAAGQIFAELFAELDHERVSYRGPARWVETFSPLTAAPAVSDAAHPWSGKVFLIMGGLGRLGLAHARYLSGLPGVKLALAGRSDVPPREQWEHLRSVPDECGQRIRELLAIEARGARVRCYKGDVTSPDQMSSLWRAVEEEFGPVFCLVHAAGIDATEHYRLLKDESAQRLLRMFAPKVQGMKTLAALAGSRRTELCIVISSISSVLGGLGLTGYSACHSFLDSFVHLQQQLQHEESSGEATSPRWLTVNWDAWALEKAADAPETPEKFAGASLNRLALSEDEAGGVLSRLCNLTHLPQVIVSTAPLEERYRMWVRREFDEAPARSEQQLRPRPVLSSSYLKPASEYEQQLARVWQQLLGIAEVGRNDNFFELGGDSLLAVQMIPLLEQQAGASLTVTDVFEHPTIAKLAAACCAEPATGSEPALERQDIELRAARQRAALSRHRPRDAAARDSAREA